MLVVKKNSYKRSPVLMKIMGFVSNNAKSSETLQGFINAMNYDINSIKSTNHIDANLSYKVCFLDDNETIVVVIHRVKVEKILATITEE